MRRTYSCRTLAGTLALACLLGLPTAASAQSFPCQIPVVGENRCTPPASWTPQFQMTSYGLGDPSGFATKTSVNRGEPLPLKLVSYGAGATATLRVYRLGWYGGAGGRLMQEISNVPMGPHTAGGPDDFGFRDFSGGASFPASHTLSGPATAVTGMYLVKVVSNTTGEQNHIPYVVRDDGRRRDLLVALPFNSWQAYNNWAGKSLYSYNSAAPVTPATNTNRAAKVGFDRPWSNVLSDYNWVLRTEFPLISWLERQGYDISYTDDLGLHSQPGELSPDLTRTLVITGHSEYWTKEMADNVAAARDAGTNLASFSANTAYWKVRLERNSSNEENRKLVGFKTIEGTGETGTGTVGTNDFGWNAPSWSASSRDVPPGAHPEDPLGPDQTALTSDDRPGFATTTFRDMGAAPGADAPNDAVRGFGRVGASQAQGAGSSRPENSLFGNLYIGDDDSKSYPLVVPEGSGNGGEFGAHPVWRRTGVDTAGATIGSNLLGWEWDAVPRGGIYSAAAAVQPSGVRRVTETNPKALSPSIEIDYLQDLGRARGPNPPPGQPPVTQAVTYEASSGAKVFASGTMQWSWGLAKHYLATFSNTYLDPPVDSSSPVIQQATYNLLADGGVQPNTPEGIAIDVPPTVVTGAAGEIDPTSATVTGSIDARGLETTYRVDYGPTTSYGSQTGSDSAGAGTSARDIAVRLTGLEPGTTYHYRVVATNASGTTAGGDRTFATPSAPPSGSPAAGAPQSPGRRGARLVLPRQPVKLSRRGVAKLRIVSEDGGDEDAEGRLTLYTAAPVSARSKRKQRYLGAASFSVSPGHSVDVAVRLPKKYLRLVTKRRRLLATAQIDVRDRTGEPLSVRGYLRLLAPSRRGRG